MRLACLTSLFLLGCSAVWAAPPVGFQNAVKVSQPTRLDWEFVATGFGKEASKLGDYDSKRQRFQLFVPRAYSTDRAWPLIVFISPGDAPIGWRSWQKVCEAQGLLYCEAYAAGNNCPPGQRVRIVLDMLDQVRRDYKIDPDRTYVGGFSGGGRMSGTLGYSLPELFGGIIPVCGTNPPQGLDYLRHRAQDRLSVAFVTGETDFNRLENEKYMAPFVKDLGVRTRLWVVPRTGHAVPGETVLTEAYRWLEEDLPRRRDDLKKRPELALPPDDALDAGSLADRLLKAAEREMKEDARLWRGVTLLQGILHRFPQTEAGKKARKLLDELKENDRRLNLAGEQGAVEERKYLLAQGQAFERFERKPAAIKAYTLLSQQHPYSEEGRKALAELRRLTGAPGAVYLGLGLAGEGLVVEKVAPNSPADKGGVQPGDKLRSINDQTLRRRSDLIAALEKVKPGDMIRLSVDRKGKTLTLTLTPTTPPE